MRAGERDIFPVRGDAIRANLKFTEQGTDAARQPTIGHRTVGEDEDCVLGESLEVLHVKISEAKSQDL